MTYTIAAFYRFTPIGQIDALQSRLKTAFTDLGICGSLLIAPEGINGTLAGTPDAVHEMLALLGDACGLPHDAVKFSAASSKPFQRLKVRKKREIITFGQPHVDLGANPNVRVGDYVTPDNWNALLAQPDVLLLDTRNAYETRIGTFKNAVVPPIETFTQFVGYVRDKLGDMKDKPVAMYCTGGIRCEKASAFMLAEGFKQVYHLQGGILKYLEQVPQSDSQWQGDCYVFDRRVAVGQGLTTGAHHMCFACGNALTDENTRHPQYEQGVACEFCTHTTSEDDKARFRMRQGQMISDCPA